MDQPFVNNVVRLFKVIGFTVGSHKSVPTIETPEQRLKQRGLTEPVFGMDNGNVPFPYVGENNLLAPFKLTKIIKNKSFENHFITRLMCS
jgi:hypothetical protein